MKIEEKILHFIQELNSESNINIGLETELLISGIIDSFSVTTLILFLEDLYGTPIEMNDQTLKSFTSVRKISETFCLHNEN